MIFLRVICEHLAIDMNLDASMLKELQKVYEKPERSGI